MNNLSKVSAIVATLLLAGCATSAHRSATTASANFKSADATIQACETTIYYTPDADSETALDCARVLDIWR